MTSPATTRVEPCASQRRNESVSPSSAPTTQATTNASSPSPNGPSRISGTRSTGDTMYSTPSRASRIRPLARPGYRPLSPSWSMRGTAPSWAPIPGEPGRPLARSARASATNAATRPLRTAIAGSFQTPRPTPDDPEAPNDTDVPDVPGAPERRAAPRPGAEARSDGSLR